MSKRFRELEKQVLVLRSQLLPGAFDPLGQYPNAEQVQTATRAFLVLGHAEVESFLEGWAKDVALKAERVWSSSDRVSPPLAFLLASTKRRLEPVDSIADSKAGDSHARLGAIVGDLFPKYYKLVKDNNGVKEKNLLAMFDPLGVPEAAFDSGLMPELNMLGSMRGKHAHHSSMAVQSVLDPEVEFQRLRRVVAALASLDSWLVKYKKRIQ